MATISELLDKKLVNQIGASPTSSEPVPSRKVKKSTSMDIDVNKLKNALVEQAKVIRQTDEDGIMDDIFSENAPDDESNNGKLIYEHPDVGGVEVIVDIDQLIPDMDDEKYKKIVRLTEEMANVDDEKGSLNAFMELKNVADNDELNVLYVLFRKSLLFDFSHEYTRELLVNLVANLCAYHLKGRALLKGILNQSTVEEHIELAIRSAGHIRAKEVLPEIFVNAKKEGNEHLIIICLEAIVNIRDTKAAVEFLPIIANIPDNNNSLIGQAIQLSRQFEVFEDSFIKPLHQESIQCTKRYLRPIYSEGLKSFGARVIPVLADFMRKSDDPFHIRSSAKIIGGIRSPLASKTLRNLLKELPYRQAEIIDGLAHTKEPENLPIMLQCLQETTRPHVKRTCITAISSVGDSSYVPVLKKYINDPDTNLEVIYALLRLGEKEAEDMYFDKMLNGTPQEQNRLENFTSLLPTKDLLKVAKKASNLPDMDAVILLSALYKPNILPKQVGPILREMLNRNPKPALPVRISIYRIIGKFVGSEKELLGMGFLNHAMKEEEPNVKRELEYIISSITTGSDTGGVTTSRR